MIAASLIVFGIFGGGLLGYFFGRTESRRYPLHAVVVWEGVAGENILNGQTVTRDEHGNVRLKLRSR